MSSLQLPDSKHFRLQQLADGVYAAIHIDGGAAIGNAGILDLGDRTLIYDTLFAPQAAEDLRAAAEALTGRPVAAVINSHYHNDHIWGNQVFSSDTDIISTPETRRLIIATKGHDDFESFKENAEANLEARRAAWEEAKDEDERRQLALWVAYYQAFVEAKSILRVRPPNLTFTQRMTFHGTDRSAELMSFEGGHTRSDAVLYLPREGVAFMSDLLFIGGHPWLGDGDPDRLSQIIDEVSELAPRLLVPGHGPVGTADSLRLMRQYIRTLDGLARKLIQEGAEEAKIDEMAVPEPFNEWLIPTYFHHNMHFLYKRRLEEQKGVAV